MFITAIVAFREFLEAFLLVGLFIGMDRKFKLGKRKEILTATILGIGVSLLLPLIVFFFANSAQHIFTEKNADILEGYLLTFSGFFLSYVVFSLHEFMKYGKKKTIQKANQKMEQEIFDLSLFFTLVFFIAREGFEIALLIATTSLFSVFRTNVLGLLLGFVIASAIGLVTSFTYIKLPIKKVFTYTELFIVLIGAAMVKNGVSLLVENYAHIHLERLLPLPLDFLPSETTVAGHAMSNLFGIGQEFGLFQLGIMLIYILLIWSLFRVKKPQIKLR